MTPYKKSVSFIDASNHKATIDVKITLRNGYQEFTASGKYLGSFGQCLDEIAPATEAQKELVELWKQYHMKDVSSIHNFKENLIGVIERIEWEENNRKENAEELKGDAAILEKMEQQGIDKSLLEAVKAYIELGTGDEDLDDFEESYQGQYEGYQDFAYKMAEDFDLITENLKWPNKHIDWQKAGEELMLDYEESNGYYFRSI